MSLAENLLNSLDETAYENMRIAGSGEEEHIIVGQDRSITVPNALKTIAVKGDKDVETATIDCVRYWDGNDLSTFAIYLNYILPNGDEGTYIPKSITKSVDFFTFDWKIGSEFTYSQGKLTFWIVAKLTDNSGTLVRQWSSFQNSDCTIAQGGDKIYVPEKQTDQDVISQAISISRASAETAEQQANLAKEAAEKAATDAREAAEDEVSRIIGELGVVQELGDSPNSVVSQLKVTKEFNKTNTKINRNSKRITNLEQGVAEQFETDASVAYVKDVPANALPYAAVAKVGGMTHKDGDTLKSAKVTEIESVGVNLCKFANGTHVLKSGVSLTLDDGHFEVDVKVSAAVEVSSLLWMPYTTVRLQAGTYTLSITNYKGLFSGAYIKDMTNNTMMVSVGEKTCNFTIDKETDVAFGLYFNFATATTETIIGDMMLNKGATAQPYRPCVKHTLPIPEAVQALDGYGWGVNESVYNYIDYEKKQFVKRVGKVDLGTLNWAWDGAIMFVQNCFNSSTKAKWVNASTKFNCISTFGDGVTFDNVYGKTRGFCTDVNGLWLYCANPGYTVVASFKAAMSGVMLYYELAEPVITDISDILPTDNLLGVEGGGTVTAVNENAFAVPTEIIYQLKGVAE